MSNFKDELNKINKDNERTQRFIDYLFYFILVASISAIYLLITT